MPTPRAAALSPYTTLFRSLTPNRKGWLGRLPVPGTGRYEWDGFRSALPKEYDPPRGFIATANHNINTNGYWPPVVFKTKNTRSEEHTSELQSLTNLVCRLL